MDGVTVLNIVERTRLPDIMVITCFLFLFGTAIFFINLLASTKVKAIDFSAIALTCCMVGALVSWIIGKTVIPNRVAQYECVIDKNVSFVELYEKYDVIEQRGDIWVLEEKVDGKVD